MEFSESYKQQKAVRQEVAKAVQDIVNKANKAFIEKEQFTVCATVSVYLEEK